MLAGETLGMEQGIPAAISRETRVSEIQHFTWISVKQLRSCTKLSPPGSLRCAPAAGMSTWTLSNEPDKPLPRRIQGRIEESGRQEPWLRRGAAIAQETVWPREQWGNFLLGPTAQGSFATTSLRSLDFCTCPRVHPPLPQEGSGLHRFTAVYTGAHLCWLVAGNLSVLCFQIQDCFWEERLILSGTQGREKRERHLKSGQESSRYWDPPVGRVRDKTET